LISSRVFPNSTNTMSRRALERDAGNSHARTHFLPPVSLVLSPRRNSHHSVVWATAAQRPTLLKQRLAMALIQSRENRTLATLGASGRDLAPVSLLYWSATVWADSRPPVLLSFFFSMEYPIESAVNYALKIRYLGRLCFLMPSRLFPPVSKTVPPSGLSRPLVQPFPSCPQDHLPDVAGSCDQLYLSHAEIFTATLTVSGSSF